MNILIRMPNWIGDAVMTTPAINNLYRSFPDARFVAVGSPSVAELFADDSRFAAVVADNTKHRRFRTLQLWRLARRLKKQHGPFDVAFAFLNSLSSRLLLFGSGARHRVGKRHDASDILLTQRTEFDPARHQVETMNDIVNSFLGTKLPAGRLDLPTKKRFHFPRPTLGINPGATYGSAKRWPSERFAEAAAELSYEFDIVIFGGPDERCIAEEIAGQLQEMGVDCFTNVAGRTTIQQLVAMIAGLDLFITNDSGPMHIAAAMGIPTVAIFGPTNVVQTSPWGNPRVAIVKRDMECSPCMQRTCPLKHHACMLEVTTDEVIDAAESLVEPGRWAAAG